MTGQIFFANRSVLFSDLTLSAWLGDDYGAAKQIPTGEENYEDRCIRAE
jgi:hypothetical protein